jgi:hypothetical protein
MESVRLTPIISHGEGAVFQNRYALRRDARRSKCSRVTAAALADQLKKTKATIPDRKKILMRV